MIKIFHRLVSSIVAQTHHDCRSKDYSWRTILKEKINVVSLLIPFVEEVDWKCSIYKLPQKFEQAPSIFCAPISNKCLGKTSKIDQVPVSNKRMDPCERVCCYLKVLAGYLKIIQYYMVSSKNFFCYILRKLKEKVTSLLHKPACKNKYVF